MEDQVDGLNLRRLYTRFTLRKKIEEGSLPFYVKLRIACAVFFGLYLLFILGNAPAFVEKINSGKIVTENIDIIKHMEYPSWQSIVKSITKTLRSFLLENLVFMCKDFKAKTDALVKFLVGHPRTKQFQSQMVVIAKQVVSFVAEYYPILVDLIYDLCVAVEDTIHREVDKLVESKMPTQGHSENEEVQLM